MARQRRDEILPQQPAEADRAAPAGRHRQGALVVRAGAPAAQARARAWRLRRPVLDRAASARADDLHRLCLSATPAPEGGGAGEKRWCPTDRRRSHRCLRSAAPSSPGCSLRLRFLIVARTATGGFFNTLPKCQSSARWVSIKWCVSDAATGLLHFALGCKLHNGFPSDDGIAAGVPLAEQGRW